MSVLDLHPAPWRYEDGCVVADDGSHVVSGGCVGTDNADASINEECLSLILSAPELLAALKRIVATDDAETRELIERIEGGK